MSGTLRSWAMARGDGEHLDEVVITKRREARSGARYSYTGLVHSPGD
jgi:hypothetical protein